MNLNADGGIDLTGQDHAMIHRAKARCPIIVDIDGRPVDAVLVAWKPRRSDGSRRRNVARVRFSSGRLLTVKPDQIQMPAVTP